ncbi:hypothetical protein P171DRAFT_439543 [Karstenula rhodostoma CBS 690.94]|uniref:Uncharacterized protein n=1 Tax=Karstenula rhodostoma CBS 690.94 TaxID=1392251 RepID=A0A9P4PVJ3_9PLEO|nr:hypothetical protein P171DRAFT_439543 [Karstenula rhodostoma CBS 690.94]
MCSKLLSFLSLLALAVIVTAAPVPESNDTAQDGKYAKDKSATRPVLSYILGGAGCLVILGIMFFACCKYKRGERVLGMQKKQQVTTMRDADIDIKMNRMRAASHQLGSQQRTLEPIYGTANLYGWSGKAPSKNAGQAYMAPDLDKPLPRRPMHDRGHREHEVKIPAPVARPSQHAGRKPVPVVSIPVVYPDRGGYYNIPLQKSGTAAPGEAHGHRYM